MTDPERLPERWKDFRDLPNRPEVSVFPDRSPRVSGEDRADTDVTLVCPRCKYSLRGIAARYCPECGFVLEYEPVTVFAASSVSLVWAAKLALDGIEVSNMVVMGGYDPFMGLGWTGTGSMPRVMVPMKFYHEAVEMLDETFGKRCFPTGEAPRRPPPGGDWVCPACGEGNPGTFDVCWNCSRSRSGQEGPAESPPAETGGEPCGS